VSDLIDFFREQRTVTREALKRTLAALCERDNWESLTHYERSVAAGALNIAGGWTQSLRLGARLDGSGARLLLQSAGLKACNVVDTRDASLSVF
jgi:hypothetical protein